MSSTITTHPPAESLVPRVAQLLRDMLVEGVIVPGAKLNERELASACDVSRTPLREAIRMLAAEGLVALLPNRGAVALELSLIDTAHTFEVIAGLEALSGVFAAQRITDTEVNEIKAINLEMHAAFLRRDLHNYYRLNAHIHAAINEAARNPVLSATYKQVNARLQALRFKSNQDADKWREALDQHDDMIDALEQRDGPRLSAILTSHLNAKRDVVLAQLQAKADANVQQKKPRTKPETKSKVI
jgi:DNA-binding GntR family transcriptional regulator